jgi:hypothetical protein
MGVNPTGYNDRNPFTQHGIVTDRTTPVSHMAKASLHYGSKSGRGRVVSKDRVLRTRKKKPATRKRKRTSTKKKGSFKKAKKISKKPVKYVTRHYDDVGLLSRDFANYIGFQRHGSMDRLWTIIGEAVAKQICARLRWYPRSYDEVVPAITKPGQDRAEISLTYKRVTVPGGENLAAPAASVIAITPTTTFEMFAYDVSKDLRVMANRDTAGDTFYAYYLDEIKIEKKSTDDPIIIEIKDVGDTMIDVYCNQVIHVQNMTKNDEGTDALDVVGTNPIIGKKYEFNNMAPKLIGQIKDTHTGYEEFQRSDDPATSLFLPTPGVPSALNRGVQDFSSTLVANEDDPISHPPQPRQLFINCSKCTPVSLAPGGRKTESTFFKMHNSMAKIVERMYYNEYDKGSFGGYTLFAFERKIRTVGGNNPVKLAFDRAVHMGAHVTFKVKKSMLKHYEKTADIVS